MKIVAQSEPDVWQVEEDRGHWWFILDGGVAASGHSKQQLVEMMKSSAQELEDQAATIRLAIQDLLKGDN